jgi:4,5-dihydroxyphthalate decarboxylase
VEFAAAARTLKYPVGEMSLAYWSFLSAAGSNRFVCLPIFLSRMFRHSALFVRKDSALMPEQLRGKRIGVSNYAMIAATHTALIVDRMKILYYHRKMRS